MNVNALPFEKFMETLSKTNRNLSFYVDWKKCLENRNSISICLNHLNLLLGKNKNEMQACVKELFAEYPKAFEVLHILIAVRDRQEAVIDSENNLYTLETYFQNADKVYSFICESGLCEVFSSGKIKDLNDYVFGIEVGLDTNARKNRSGNAMEQRLADIFRGAGLTFQEQVSIKEHPKLSCLFGEDIKRFDFVIDGGREHYAIECNFYSSGGSKLNETARSYQELASKFQQISHCHFVWITDGHGWFDAKNKLQEAYKSVEIYNLSNIDNFIKKISNA